MDEALEALRSVLARGRCLVGFDFDGTLVPLQRDPDAVRLPERARIMLARLGERHECALISGRGLEDLSVRAKVTGFHLVGNHGAQILKKDGQRWAWRSEAWESWQQANPRPFQELFQAHGGHVEDKGLSLAIHFRQAWDEQWWEGAGPLLAEKVKGVAEIMPGMMCWNVTPLGAPHKGDAALRLCRELELDSIVFFGDEATDENVFEVRALPVHGIKVGAGESKARYRLGHPDEVLTLIDRLLS